MQAQLSRSSASSALERSSGSQNSSTSTQRLEILQRVFFFKEEHLIFKPAVRIFLHLLKFQFRTNSLEYSKGDGVDNLSTENAGIHYLASFNRITEVQQLYS